MANTAERVFSDYVQPWLAIGADEPTHVEFVIWPVSGGDNRLFKFSQANRMRALQALATHTASRVEVSITRGAPRKQRALSFTIDLGSTDEVANSPRRLQLSVPDELILSSNDITSFVDLAKSTAKTLDTTTGFITPGSSYGPFTEHEMTIAQHDGLRISQFMLRGVHWGNFLSKVHVEQLGGIARVLREAPGTVRENLSTQDKTLVYLQISDSPFSTIENSTQALTNYLSLLIAVGPVAVDQQPTSSFESTREPVELLIDWRHFDQLPDLVLTVVVEEASSDDLRRQLREVIESWYHLGSLGAFGEPFRFFGEMSFATMTDEGEEISVAVDFGQSNARAAIEMLGRCLQSVLTASPIRTMRLELGRYTSD